MGALNGAMKRWKDPPTWLKVVTTLEKHPTPDIMYRLRLHGLCGLYRPGCPLYPERLLNIASCASWILINVKQCQLRYFKLILIPMCLPCVYSDVQIKTIILLIIVYSRNGITKNHEHLHNHIMQTTAWTLLNHLCIMLKLFYSDDHMIMIITW